MERMPTLFDQQPADAPKPVDLADMAAQIAANATQVEYPDRTSEAAREQGRGVLILPKTPSLDSTVIQEQPEASTTHAKTRLELPGKNGRRNHGTKLLTPREAQSGMTTEQIDRQNVTNKVGVASVRAALQEAAEKRV